MMELGKERLERWSISLQQTTTRVCFVLSSVGRQYDVEGLSRGNEPATTNNITPSSMIVGTLQNTRGSPIFNDCARELISNSCQ